MITCRAAKGELFMTKSEIAAFIKIMKEIQEDWTPEQVEEAYGNLTLKEALDKRMSKIKNFYDFVEEVVQPDKEKSDLWQG